MEVLQGKLNKFKTDLEEDESEMGHTDVVVATGTSGKDGKYKMMP